MPKFLSGQKKAAMSEFQFDGNLYDLSEEIKLNKNVKHNIEIVVDRLIIKPGIEKRLKRFYRECTGYCRRSAYS